jgi:hypothetical protein
MSELNSDTQDEPLTNYGAEIGRMKSALSEAMRVNTGDEGDADTRATGDADLFTVTSASGSEYFNDHDGMTGDCPDNHHNVAKDDPESPSLCKHMYRSLFATGKLPIPQTLWESEEVHSGFAANVAGQGFDPHVEDVTPGEVVAMAHEMI